ncbi:MAG TPA: hypothetical protein VN380_09230 [Thermoanaerobaculia bacterium]|jgi:hypothetical protein|nr:hypothetical protein [Thermoanaerobaculia bacterium]
MRLRIVTILVVLTAAAAANAQVQQVRQYAAKFVCGTPNPKQLNFAPGTYYTTINVHNPALTATIEFRKKFALAEVDEKPGKISQWFGAALRADQALQIDCRNIYAHLGITPGTFIDGFAVIQLSPKQELDVVGVYTAAPPGGGVSTMHMERVAGRLTQ